MAEKRVVDIDQVFEQGTPIDDAMDQALVEAIERHRRAGVPMVFWEDGKSVWVSADELDLGDEPKKFSEPSSS
jgi:hypothetical protein